MHRWEPSAKKERQGYLPRLKANDGNGKIFTPGAGFGICVSNE